MLRSEGTVTATARPPEDYYFPVSWLLTAAITLVSMVEVFTGTGALLGRIDGPTRWLEDDSLVRLAELCTLDAYGPRP
ncbi:hypothetical protein [Nocardia ninae]|nr:hypothetical protein [Nocardia ninae]